MASCPGLGKEFAAALASMTRHEHIEHDQALMRKVADSLSDLTVRSGCESPRLQMDIMYARGMVAPTWLTGAGMEPCTYAGTCGQPGQELPGCQAGGRVGLVVQELHTAARPSGWHLCWRARRPAGMPPAEPANITGSTHALPPMRTRQFRVTQTAINDAESEWALQKDVRAASHGSHLQAGLQGRRQDLPKASAGLLRALRRDGVHAHRSQPAHTPFLSAQRPVQALSAAISSLVAFPWQRHCSGEITCTSHQHLITPCVLPSDQDKSFVLSSDQNLFHKATLGDRL